jgi:hypothetical protein
MEELFVSMEKLFVPVELAIKLKHKGFDEPCMGYYTHKGEFGHHYHFLAKKTRNIFSATNSYVNELVNDGRVMTPLYQQVVDWFRDEHKIVLVSAPLNTLGWWDAMAFNSECDRIFRFAGYKTYYEALYVSIEEALKLI